jgi:tetratricopeptide (TPR) repeat protein
MHCKIKLFSVFILSSVLVASVAASNEEIQRMIQQGSFEKALVLAEEQLSVNPDEIQTLFLKGLILARMDRLKESEAVFIGLTEKHPELPEPYNNLAVVYAASGDYDKAEEALRQAINTHPSYATAHENLGDIYAKMASQAYNNALKLDSDNQETREKLSMISDLISVPEAVAVAQSVPKTAPTSVKKEIRSEPTLAKFEPEPTNLLEPPFDRDAARKDAESRMQEEKKQLEEAKRALDDAQHEAKITEAAREGNEEDHLKQKEEEKLNRQMQAELNDWIEEEDERQEQFKDSVSQAEHIKRIRERAEAARQKTEEAADNLFSDISDQISSTDHHKLRDSD